MYIHVNLMKVLKSDCLICVPKDYVIPTKFYQHIYCRIPQAEFGSSMIYTYLRIFNVINIGIVVCECDAVRQLPFVNIIPGGERKFLDLFFFLSFVCLTVYLHFTVSV